MKWFVGFLAAIAVAVVAWRVTQDNGGKGQGTLPVQQISSHSHAANVIESVWTEFDARARQSFEEFVDDYRKKRDGYKTGDTLSDSDKAHWLGAARNSWRMQANELGDERRYAELRTRLLLAEAQIQRDLKQDERSDLATQNEKRSRSAAARLAGYGAALEQRLTETR